MSLDISDNQLTGLRELAKCKSIITLYASQNRLKSLSGIQNLNLYYLDVSMNQLTDLKEISNMENLDTLKAQSNRLKKLPNLKNVHVIYLEDNLLDEKELRKNLPANTFEDELVFKAFGRDLIEFQNLNCKLSLKKPTAKKISKNTKTIKGKVSAPDKFKVSVQLTRLHTYNDKDQKPNKPVKTDKNGNFTLKNLDLSDWEEKEVRVDLVLYNPKTKNSISIPTDTCFTVKN